MIKKADFIEKIGLVGMKNLVSLQFHSVDDVDAVNQQFQGT